MHPAVYEYQALSLWIASGVSIVNASFCAAIGLLAMSGNEASYSNKSSTPVRVSRNTHLYDLIHIRDDGAKPCPDDLRQAKVELDKSVADR